MRLSLIFAALALSLVPLASGQPAAGTTILSVGPEAEYSTVQAAVEALAGVSGPVEIQLSAGVYEEKVEIAGYRGGLTLSAQGGRATIKSSSFKDFGDPDTSNRDASTLIVSGTDMAIENVDIVNEPQGKGPAQAILIEKGSSVTMIRVSLQSYQDTVYVQGGSRAVCVSCSIVGAVDFLYGEGTLYIEGSSIQSVGPGPIAAWRGGMGYRGSTPGCYIANSEITGVDEGSVYLGRPWDDEAVIVYVKTEMSAAVNPAGWKVWNSDDPRVSSATTFIEIGSSGPGFDETQRQIGKVLPLSEAGTYSYASVWGTG